MNAWKKRKKSACNHLLTFYQYLIGLGLGILGSLCGCDMPTQRRTQPLYGMPTIDLGISGQIKAAETNEPVAGIRVTCRDTSSRASFADTTITGSDGFYQFIIPDESRPGHFKVQADDIDGTVNGLFSSKDTVVVDDYSSYLIKIDMKMDTE